MKRDISIELGPYLNLFSRLTNKDTPRSIALAKRTYQRSSINRKKINLAVEDSTINSKVNNILDNFEKLKKSKNFESDKFIENMNSLIKLLD